MHHGDGVEEAFYTTDRVMTCSFHKYGEYFPGTGELRDIGIGTGKNYAVNFPLRDGITDETYKSVFEPTISAIMTYFQPEAVVLQCGGDSLSGDRLGCFNLSMRGHANCVKFVKSFGIPVIVLGGGGYTMRNVARTWAYETGALVGNEMSPQLPYNDYYEYFAPDYELDVRPSNMENANSKDYLTKIRNTVIDNIRRTGKPSVEAFQVIPPSLARGMDDDESDEEDDLDADRNPDKRVTQRQRDKMVVRDDEFEEASEDEEYRESLGVRRQPGAERRRGIMSYQNPDAVPDEFEVPHTMNGDPVRSRKSATPSASGVRNAPATADENGDIDMDTATPAENASVVDSNVPTTANSRAATAEPSDAAPTSAPAATADPVEASPANLTPPESPPVAPAAAPATAADVEMADTMDTEDRAEAIQREKDEGLKERVEEEERAEARTEALADKK